MRKLHAKSGTVALFHHFTGNLQMRLREYKVTVPHFCESIATGFHRVYHQDGCRNAYVRFSGEARDGGALYIACKEEP